MTFKLCCKQCKIEINLENTPTRIITTYGVRETAPSEEIEGFYVRLEEEIDSLWVVINLLIVIENMKNCFELSNEKLVFIDDQLLI